MRIIKLETHETWYLSIGIRDEYHPKDVRGYKAQKSEPRQPVFSLLKRMINMRQYPNANLMLKSTSG